MRSEGLMEGSLWAGRMLSDCAVGWWPTARKQDSMHTVIGLLLFVVCYFSTKYTVFLDKN